ncbi:hypothetical protein PC116_g6122 [Phytophthora cactorum]|uniref:Uncharacterized protein n=1 Tax=Phytophthora cactorum TaxID=29920 RepID=A0A8T1E9Q1_9STRA|nr:hypothetical protein PC117_g3818 [Phytophthora cactorum]KAG2984260.1 hypothetical protein PC119_g20434 [Phytophthora cactorum]KAG4246094.1 hypothetical protein PC116_g6122 [Phytophthora cactorum]
MSMSRAPVPSSSRFRWSLFGLFVAGLVVALGWEVFASCMLAQAHRTPPKRPILMLGRHSFQRQQTTLGFMALPIRADIRRTG